MATAMYRRCGKGPAAKVNHSSSSSVRCRLGLVLLLVTAWGGLVTLFAAQLVLVGAMEWSEALGVSIPAWLAWVGLLPLTAWLAFRFSLERGRLAVSLPVHLAACLLAVLLCQFGMWQLVKRNPNFPQRPGPPELRESARGHGPPFGRPPAGRGSVRAVAFRIPFDALIYWVTVSVCHSVVWSRRSQQRERRALELEARLSQARLQTLRMQIHPHFLFNTLNAISTLVHTNPHAADNMIGSLSELLRLSLGRSEEQEVPLEQELDFLQRYLEIEQVRFGDRLRVVPDIAADTRAAFVPTLILQPIVENAIRHGIEKQLAPGTITLRSRREGARLILSVEDTGPGLNPAAQNAGGHGIGLANTRARLEQLYGAGQQFSLRGGERGGCVARLEMPFHLEPMPAARPMSS